MALIIRINKYVHPKAEPEGDERRKVCRANHANKSEATARITCNMAFSKDENERKKYAIPTYEKRRNTDPIRYCTELIRKRFPVVAMLSQRYSLHQRIAVVLFISLIFPLTSFIHAPNNEPRVIRVIVALCDNESQGIVPVPKKIGNGNDPANNLYWGCAYGVKTYFTNSPDWEVVQTFKSFSDQILERIVFRHRASGTLIISDAWKGSLIKSCTKKYLQILAGTENDTIRFTRNGNSETLLPGAARMAVYVGHDGLMDFSIEPPPAHNGSTAREAIILACASKIYFKEVVKTTGAKPLLWTTNLMAPEAYSLKAALDGWIKNESDEQIRQRAAAAYSQYQHCSLSASQRLFATGF